MRTRIPDNPSPPAADPVRFVDPAGPPAAEAIGEFSHPRPPIWEKVKQNASRTVYRGVVAGREIYLKHFHTASAWGALVRRLGQSHAHKEVSVYRRLKSRKVPVATVVAATWGSLEQWVATEAVAPAEPADTWHRGRLAEGQEGLRAVRRASKALAKLLAHMHAAGVVHHDLHCGNVLVRTDRPGARSIKLVLMDLHRTGQRRRVSRRARAKGLAQLCHDRLPWTTRSDRLRFLRQYLQAGGIPGSLRGWQNIVSLLAGRHAQRQYAQRDRRILRTGRYFARVDLPSRWKGHVVLASKRRPAASKAAEMQFTVEQWRDALAEPEALGSGERAAVVKDSPSGLVVRRTIRIGDSSLDIFVKRARRKHFWKIVVDCFRRPRAVRAFVLGHALLSRRLATPLPLAAVQRRAGPLLLDSLLITEAVDGPRLEDFLRSSFGHDRSGPPAGQAPRAHRLLRRLGRMLQRLHDAGFSHRDLKTTNVLVSPPAEDGAAEQPVLVDLDGLRRGPLTTRRRMLDLARLDAGLRIAPTTTAANRLRVLRGYLSRPGCGRPPFKVLWRVIDQWVLARLRRKARSRRQPPAGRGGSEQ